MSGHTRTVYTRTRESDTYTFDDRLQRVQSADKRVHIINVIQYRQSRETNMMTRQFRGAVAMSLNTEERSSACEKSPSMSRVSTARDGFPS